LWENWIYLNIGVFLHHNYTTMGRQTITVNAPNDEWMKKKVQSNEYSSKSELINDLIRKQREKDEELDWLRRELIKGEESGISNKSLEDILHEAKLRAKKG
jgi:antitoxin ParD1/3/4